ncbi:hypothetical protein SD961_15940 [Erwinia sp. MMLR14_017]|uniref:hypothetical protein n=1 Tax=Erwinia sp. MMLR14_017 TaxID=3093842 RepID=UPI00298FDF71|nr:hypothetical protein [Erwinia sp. MMLR14_017]MDW8847359.1 hypothetical protein [Erwinia sp. MMLR14_017]
MVTPLHRSGFDLCEHQTPQQPRIQWVAPRSTLAECMPQGCGIKVCADAAQHIKVNITHYGVSANVLYGDAFTPNPVLTCLNAKIYQQH